MRDTIVFVPCGQSNTSGVVVLSFVSTWVASMAASVRVDSSCRVASIQQSKWLESQFQHVC